MSSVINTIAAILSPAPALALLLPCSTEPQLCGTGQDSLQGGKTQRSLALFLIGNMVSTAGF